MSKSAVNTTIQQAQEKIAEARMADACWKAFRSTGQSYLATVCKSEAMAHLEEARLLLALADWERAHA